MRMILWSCVAGLLMAFAGPVMMGQAKAAVQVKVEADGTVEVPAESVPTSKFLTPKGRAYLVQHLHDMQDPTMTYTEKGVPRFMRPYVERQKALFPVRMEDTSIGGVHVFLYLPAAGLKAENEHRVLIDLHGGGFSGCWPGCAELESMPMAALGRIKVVSVDYREGPEHVFPAASEDVASVYGALLKEYKPGEIGIYGCSAGGMLTAESVAWFQKHGLPRPGAVGIYCASAGAFGGDATYTSTPLGEGRFMPAAAGDGVRLGYFKGTDPKDPLVTPLASAEVMAKFPPTLVITGTRDFAMSGAIFTHSELTRLGVEAELHVWEGMFHGFFYNPDVPESRDAYAAMTKFFETHLER